MKSTWQTQKLGELYEITSSKRVFKSEWKNEGVPFYRAREIVKLAQNGFVKNELYISNEMFEKYSTKYGVPKADDIMVTGVGTLGICYVVKDSDKFYFKDGNIIWLKRNSDIDTRFVEYAFKSDLLRKQIDNSVGATVGTFTIIKAKNTLIPVPSVTEQKRIVKILDSAFESIAKAKTNAEKNLQNSKNIFETYLQDIFTRTGENWEETQVSEICEIQYGYTDKAKGNGDFRFVRITDTDENGLLTQNNKMYVDTFKDAFKYILTSGDLLMARTGASAGNLLYFEGDEKSVFASYLIRMQFKKEIYGKFYWYFSKSKLYWDQVKQLSAGSAQPQFNGGPLKQIIFPFPKLISEQKSIVEKLDKLSAETKKLELIYQQKLADLEELKKSILTKAFNGEL